MRSFLVLQKTEERSKIYEYGEALYAIQYAFATRVGDKTDYVQESDLNGQSIGVIGGTKSARYLKEHYKNYDEVPVDSIQQALKMLNAGRINGVFYHDLGLSYQVSSLGFSSSIKVKPSSAKPRKQYLAYSKSTEQSTQKQVNDAFAHLVASGTQTEILKKYGLNEESF